eukprot:365740-Chlamydomonas_euryale.AAC.2
MNRLAELLQSKQSEMAQETADNLSALVAGGGKKKSKVRAAAGARREGEEQGGRGGRGKAGRRRARWAWRQGQGEKEKSKVCAAARARREEEEQGGRGGKGKAGRRRARWTRRQGQGGKKKSKVRAAAGARREEEEQGGRGGRGKAGRGRSRWAQRQGHWGGDLNFSQQVALRLFWHIAHLRCVARAPRRRGCCMRARAVACALGAAERATGAAVHWQPRERLGVRAAWHMLLRAEAAVCARAHPGCCVWRPACPSGRGDEELAQALVCTQGRLPVPLHEQQRRRGRQAQGRGGSFKGA